MDPPKIRLAAVVIGTTAWSSRLVVELEAEAPTVLSTPTTVSGRPLTVTVWPTGSRTPNSSCAVVAPSTATAASAVSSAAVMKRPSATLRARTDSQSGWCPTTVVVQLVPAAVSVSDRDVAGATAAMSGATVFDASAVASASVSVEALPNPPRMPVLAVVELRARRPAGSCRAR